MKYCSAIARGRGEGDHVSVQIDSSVCVPGIRINFRVKNGIEI